MGHAEYKFENFMQPWFPIFASKQSGREVLIKPHYHPSGEIVLVLEGQIKLLVGTTYRECKKGDIVFIPPSIVHEAFSLTEDAAIQGIVFEFSLIQASALRLDFMELFNRSQGLLYVISSEDKGHEELRDYIEKIWDVYGGFSADCRIRIVSNLLLIMGVLIRIFSLEVSTHDKNYQRLKPVLEHIETHFEEKIQISELSEIIHVCDDRLIRLFKEVTGETPIEYIMNLRIEAAIKLLSLGELSVSEIAEQTGFGGASYMTRVFKRRLNSPPGKFRKKSND
ncbi:MAG: helix-turn-helix transcriptional regulator [Lachnospiraceae bacterium]|nr:helix-turn-helix transcriptional regulator [Lachnospiraceae bacterium]